MVSHFPIGTFTGPRSSGKLMHPRHFEHTLNQVAQNATSMTQQPDLCESASAQTLSVATMRSETANMSDTLLLRLDATLLPQRPHARTIARRHTVARIHAGALGSAAILYQTMNQNRQRLPNRSIAAYKTCGARAATLHHEIGLRAGTAGSARTSQQRQHDAKHLPQDRVGRE